MSARPARGVLALVLVGSVVLMAGCSINTGPTQEVIVDEPLGPAAVTDVEVSMGAGKLTVGPGATGLVSGTIRYNVEPWKPEVERTDTRVTIEQGSQRGLSGLGGDVVNEWQLQLGGAPMRLKVSAGAYEGTYDLGGLILQELTIKDGAARSQVRFDSPNPGQMETLRYETGASTVTLTGLANANFRTLDFIGGAGSYTFDFSGQLRGDATARIKAGVGTVRIEVPAQTAARVVVQGSLTDISVEGTWTASGKTYSTPAAAAADPGRLLTIEVSMSVGTLDLVVK